MAVFNRILTTVLLLALIPIVTITLILPKDVVQFLVDGLDQIESQLDSSVSVWEMLIRVGLVLLIDIVLVGLVYFELRRPPRFGVPVRRIKGGDALIAIDSIVDRLTYKIDQLPGVLAVEPQVTAHRRGTQVRLDIQTVADANMRANLEEISAVTRRVVEQEMGLKLVGKPKLNLRTVHYPEPIAGADPMAPDVDAWGDEQESAQSGEDERALPDLSLNENNEGMDEPRGSASAS